MGTVLFCIVLDIFDAKFDKFAHSQRDIGGVFVIEIGKAAGMI